MCKIAVKLTDATHPDPEISKSGCFKRFDVVAVLEDDQNPGAKVVPPKFGIISIPGVPASEFKYLEKAPFYLDANGNEIATGRAMRSRFLDLDNAVEPMVSMVASLPGVSRKLSELRLGDRLNGGHLVLTKGDVVSNEKIK